MEEYYVDIPGYEGKYQASNLGNIRIFKNNTYRLLNKSKTDRGYLKSYLNGKQLYNHRLVASTFLGLDLDDRYTLACHKDDNIENNNKNNIFLGSQEDNMKDKIKKGRGKCNRILNELDVLVIRKLYEDGSTVKEIGLAFNKVKVSTIESIVKNKRWNNI